MVDAVDKMMTELRSACAKEQIVRSHHVIYAQEAIAALRAELEQVKQTLAVRDHESDFLKRRGDKAVKRAEAAERRILPALAEPAGEAEPCQFLATEDGEFNGNTFSDDPVPFGWITQSAYDRVNNSSLPEKVTIIRNAVGPTDMPRVALYTTPPDASAITGAPTHRHKKRGTEYTLIGIGKMQAERWADHDKKWPYASKGSVDMREVAIYRCVDDGSLWVRPREEFEDGRFEALAGAKP